MTFGEAFIVGLSLGIVMSASDAYWLGFFVCAAIVAGHFWAMHRREAR